MARRTRQHQVKTRSDVFVKVDCAACHHVALLTPEVLRRAGLSPAAKVLDRAVPVPRVREEGASGRFDQVEGAGRSAQ